MMEWNTRASICPRLRGIVCTVCAMSSHRIYFWRVQNRNGRWYQTRFRTTEEYIRSEHPEAQRVETDYIEVPDVDLSKPMYSGNYRNG